MDSLDLRQCPEFQRKVLRAVYAVPRGSVSTYGLIAKYLKKPGGARAVGSALAANPFPIIFPCHRVVRMDGALGGYQGGSDMKRALLQKEGVVVSRTGRVSCGSFYYGKGQI